MGAELGKRTARLALAVVATLAAISVQGAEVVVQNDSLGAGGTGTIQAGFDPPESAGVWLTSPCDGDIRAVQVFWRSTTGVEPQMIEDSIKIFTEGTFPSPGAELASIDGPVMTDGVINEFRFLDENMVIPLIVPVTDGQTFVVAFKFLNDPNEAIGPSLVNDNDGIDCNRNAIDANGFGWFSSCLFQVSGDWVIRAVVDCETVGGGRGSVPNGGDAPGDPLRVALVGGQVELSWSESCSTGDDDYQVYEGFLGAYYSHFSEVCTTGGATTASVGLDMFDRYYLVVPTNGTQEGSYGRDGVGNERPQGGNACQSQGTITCPVP